MCCILIARIGILDSQCQGHEPTMSRTWTNYVKYKTTTTFIQSLSLSFAQSQKMLHTSWMDFRFVIEWSVALSNDVCHWIMKQRIDVCNFFWAIKQNGRAWKQNSSGSESPHRTELGRVYMDYIIVTITIGEHTQTKMSGKGYGYASKVEASHTW
jgi:hypothetical protein